ncbi:type VI secretion-associated protein (plasmid) [Burkholderia sp. SFA1]|uniref:type VI secretion system-associated protein TagF n=1 Tax=unclassified Caballeronia TaxID=2646786 RepID=UPI001F174D03|nr:MULTISPECIES: type VI secretion system-associated protein TagF [unclassified Caballeronia]MCE4545744.1 type VI secretion system-associated protein TagF [Caballeronia sp. PC1]MCE4572134.1 type VI secretion system-associated protein TagF [Caballeronia sp. CLC5]BBQ01094.1 type VI secretion-associated protein [Burkholderia sp. SFA1]
MSDAPDATLTAGDAGIAGWYGKLPSLGDFAARRLPDAFVAPWDAWLARRVGETRRALGPDWLDLYLTCPVWRFFAMPGAIAPTLASCWTGVVMASVDRVGRHFPLTVAASPPCAPATGAEVAALWRWLSAIEGVALAALDFDHGIERLDEQLAALPMPIPAPPCADALDEPCIVHSADALADTLAHAFAPLWQAGARGTSLWTSAQAQHEASDASAFTVWPVRGLPDTALFTALLRGCGS